MKYIRDRTLVNRNILFAAFTLLALILAGSSLSVALAQGPGDWAISQAQQAVRERITNQEGGRGPNVLFNSDAQTELRSNAGVRVRGTGTFSRNNNSRNNNSRYNDGQSRTFSYEAIVNNRNNNRNNNGNNNRNVSGIRYDWSGGWSGSGIGNSVGGGRGYGGQIIYLASDDGRRHTYPVNTRGGVRLVTQKSDAACVPGRSWGYTTNGIWVDRGCRADFEVGGAGNIGGGGRGNNDRGNIGGGYVGGNRPDGRVSYSGPIMNRHSDKSLDVTGQSTQDGANIQQWGFADQANQNWDVVDIGNGEAAIISRHSGLAITIQGGRDNNGANIIQRSWSGSPQQRWRLEQVGGDYYRIVSVDNGKCLDVTAQGKENGAHIQLWDYANQANQQWKLKR